MPNHRPSTLKLCRVYLDVYEALAERSDLYERTTYEELAVILQERYRSMPAYQKSEYFGQKPDESQVKDGFPSVTTIQRYLGWLEEDLAGFVPSRQLVPRNKSGLSCPNSEDVECVRSIVEGFLRQLRSLGAKKRQLILAASNSVGSFLLPRVNVGQVLGERFQLRVQEFSPSEVVDGLRARRLDAAVGFDGGYRNNPRVDDADGIHARVVEGSACRIHVLFHPHQTALSYKKRAYLQKHAHDFEGASFALTPEDLRGCCLVVPDLHQLVRIGNAFYERKLGDVLQLDHFAAVVSAVRANNGVGLFPGYPWLLRELEHEHRVLSAKLEVSESWDVNLMMRLKAYTRAADDSPITADATVAANNLLAELEGTLENFGYPRTTVLTQWRLGGRAAPLSAWFESGQSWYIHFVTCGRFERAITPRWSEGRVEFTSPDNGRFGGLLYVGKEEPKPFMRVRVEPGPLERGILVLQFERLEAGASLASDTVAYLPSRVTNSRFDGTCLLGTLNFAVGDRPFCGPILFSNRKLDHECRGIARSRVLDFLYGDEPEA